MHRNAILCYLLFSRQGRNIADLGCVFSAEVYTLWGSVFLNAQNDVGCIHVPFMPGIQVRNLFARIDFRPKGVQTAMST